MPVVCCDCEVCRSGDPRDRRTRTSVLVETAGRRLLIDSGPDLRAQLLREGIDDLDGIIYTHPHKDHTAGLDDVRPINYFRDKHIELYANDITIQRLREEYVYIFEGDYPGVPLIRLHRIDERPFQACGIPVTPIPAMHGNMPVLGFRIGGFSYLTDTNAVPESSVELMRRSDMLVLNALRRESHYSHFTLNEALEVAGKVGAKATYLIHMSHHMGFHAKVEQELPEGVSLSYDGLVLHL